ncbi:glycosyltransferase family 39 protein [Chishuiella sp.]|uniref:ArnT family glycosyltransferase n=1 Tax=Chishuiella sp. TaxID=1969467 RepID=UPI0028A5D3E1|nr:glycosyltransferase family 39 protein [Chishuiella sp.]
MIHWIKNNKVLFLIIITIIMLFVNLGILQTNIMEARNIISAREMVNQGNWIFTTLNGLPRYEKPPLPTWITAFFGSVFGFENFFWLRIPVVLVTLLLVYSFYKIAIQLDLSKEQIVNSSLILITSFYVFFAGRDNNWDMYTHSFMLVSIFFLLKEFQSKKFNFLNFTVAFFFLGCSIMSKGPVSLYALFLPFLLAYFCVYTNRLKHNISITVLVLIAGCIVGFAWILYVRYFDAEHFLAASKKEMNSWQNHNTRPFYYYWSFFTQSGLWTIPALVSLIYPYLKNKVSNKKAYKFVWLWTIFSVVLLSLIPEKKSRYLLPVLIPLALNTSFYIEYLRLEFKNLNSKTEKSITNIIFGLYGIIAFAISIGVFIYTKNEFANYAILTIPFSIITFFLGLLIIKGLKTKSFDQIFYSSILLMSTFVIFGFPLSKVTFSEKYYSSTSSIKKLEKKYNIKTYETDGFIPEIVLDYGQPIPTLSENGNVSLPKASQFGLLANKNDSVFISKNLNKYSIKKIGEVNLNHSLKEQKNYNDRIQKDYFLVQLK